LREVDQMMKIMRMSIVIHEEMSEMTAEFDIMIDSLT
jgi:hypothetical protein